MPTVLRAHGLRFVIFVDDHPPAHVHVVGRGEARIAIADPNAVLTITGMSKPDVARAQNVVRLHRNTLLDAWTRIHG